MSLFVRKKEISSDSLPTEGARGISLALLAILLVFTALLSFSLGHYPVPLPTVVQAIISKIIPGSSSEIPEQVYIALFNIRLPRILLGGLVGAGLSAAGATFQASFRNPIVSPGVLGASSGAAFGAALGIIWNLSSIGVSLVAFLFGLVAVAIVLLISRKVNFEVILGMVLCGMVVSSLFAAALSYIKLIADQFDELPVITFWLMGSLASADFGALLYALPPIFIGTLIIWKLRWQLNLLTLGDEQAKTMGVEVDRIRLILIVSSTLVTAASVAVCGQIGWIGLVVPHFSMLIFGADYRESLTGTILIGATFTIGIDLLARTLASSEIPIGILSSFLGAPLFFYLLLREGGR